MSALLGTKLSGRYRLEARIGSGGMSTVYRALDETLQRKVAIKLMNREVTSDSDELERFRREARAVAQLSHPHIVGVIDAGEDEGRPYIVFEYVEGETLKERIRRAGRLPIPEAVAYAIEIARALGCAHEHHIVHRDVKPQNVLIDEEGSAKVTDFGIARSLNEDGLTADGRVLGTTDYVSPEQALGRPVTGQSDLYSLGIALYEMITGEVPFTGENQIAVAMKHVREQLPDVQAKRPEVSAALAAVVDNATAKQLESRYRDARELIADLEDALAIETSRAGNATGEVTAVLRTLPSRKQRRVAFWLRHRIVTGLLVVLVIAAVAGVALWLASRTHHGVGKVSPPSARKPTAVVLCQNCAHSYNPDGLGGDTSQNDNQVGLAIDDNPTTYWQTEQYYSGMLGKPGVGIYVDASPGVVARKLKLLTNTPGWSVQIRARNTPPNLRANDPGGTADGWTQIGRVSYVKRRTSIPVATVGQSYRYYLIWITGLPPHQNSVEINEIKLYG
jgi:serine/threonine-protein kinase